MRLSRKGQLHEGLFEVGLLRLARQLGHRALGHRAALGDDDDLVAQPFDLLHDVGGEHDALAFVVAQPAQRLAQRTRGQHDPPNIVLDEPTNGLDVLATRALREALRRLRDEHGKCIVFSTHIMQEVERLCDEVVVVAGGRTVASGSVASLCAHTGHADFEDAFVALAFPDAIALPARLEEAA